MRRVRLVIADRRPIVVQGFVSLLETQPDFEVVACCLDGASCLAAIRRLTPDVVLLEDGFTDVTASDMLAVVDNEDLSSRLLFFTAAVTCGDLARALATGACSAISMNAKPEALVQSLRLENPGSDLARVGSEAKGSASFGNNVLAVLTVNERTVMDLVAEGLSDREIARVLGVSLEIVRIHIDHARQKLGSNSRTELAALALSRRYGAMSILIAAILAALDDSPGHAATESFTVAADGDTGVVTIKIGGKEAALDGTPARGASKERAGAATGTSSPIAKLVDPAAEIATGLFAQAAPNAPRLGSSGYSIFMTAAFAAFIYELDGANHAAQAFDFGDDIVTSSAVSDAIGLASALPDIADFGGTAMYGASAFEFAQGDAIATGGSELHVRTAYAEDGGSNRQVAIPQGSGAVDVVAAAANDAAQGGSTHPGRDDTANQGQSQSDFRASDNSSEAARHEAAADDLNHGQSQKALRESDDSSGAAKGHAKNEAAGDGSNHGQSQKALHESDNGSGAAKGHAKYEAAGDRLNHGQSQKAVHEPDNGSGAAKGHAKHEPSEDGLNHGQSQKALQGSDKGSEAAKGPAKLEAQGDDSNRGQAHSDLQTFEGTSAAGKQPSHSFHFKSGADNSADMHNLQHLSHGNGKAYAGGQHVVARQGPEPVQDANGIDISDAPHEHSWRANLHAAHDLIV